MGDAACPPARSPDADMFWSRLENTPVVRTVPFALLLAVSLVHGGYGIGRALLGLRRIDFAQYYVAARCVLAGSPRTMYDTGALYQTAAAAAGVPGCLNDDGSIRDVMTFAYPPAVAYLFVPLALMPYRAAGCVFALASLAALAAGVLLLFADREPSRRRTLVLLGLLVTAMFAPVQQTLLLGQVNCVIFFCCALCLYFARRRRMLLAGLVVALAIHIKLFPLVLLPFFVLRRQYRLVATSLLMIVLIAGATAAMGGLDLFGLYLSKILPSQYSAGAYFANQGFDGFFTRLLVRNEYVNSLGDSPAAAHVAALGSGLLVVALTYAVARLRFSQEQPWYDLGFSLCLVAALLFQAKSYEHHAVISLFAYLVMIEALAYENSGQKWLLVVVCFSFAVWSFLLTSGADYLKLPRSVVMNALFSAKFLATLALWTASMCLLLVAHRSAVGERVESRVSGRG